MTRTSRDVWKDLDIVEKKLETSTDSRERQALILEIRNLLREAEILMPRGHDDSKT
jgi:hypothetical protein